MKIICAGIGKTGTTSITKALRHLGFTVFDWEEQTLYFIDHWVDVFQNGAQPDVKRLYQNVDVLVDSPGNFFWEEVLEAFPESKVILSEREEDSWVKSLVNQLQLITAVRYREFYRMLSPTTRKIYFVFYSYLNAALGTTNPRSTTVFHKRYCEHSHRVKSLVPPEKLSRTTLETSVCFFGLRGSNSGPPTWKCQRRIGQSSPVRDKIWSAV